jgi:hypothetical protein
MLVLLLVNATATAPSVILYPLGNGCWPQSHVQLTRVNIEKVISLCICTPVKTCRSCPVNLKFLCVFTAL